MLRDYYTIRQLAERLGVCRQRVHQLIETYSVKTDWLGSVLVISRAESKKIPKTRPIGRHRDA